LQRDAPKLIEITSEHAGRRLDRVVVDHIDGLGRAGATRLFAAGRVRVVAGSRRRRANKGEPARLGSFLEVDISSEELDQQAVADPSVALTVILEAPHVVVVDKPAGIASAPIRPAETAAIANGLVSRYPEMRGVGYRPREPGLCHRLDVGTSGLLLAARSSPAFAELTEAIKRGGIDKRYLLVCVDRSLEDEGCIDCALVPGRRRVRVRPAGTAGARAVSTRYRLLERCHGVALVEASAPRAYRHQLRACFASIGAPIIGDETYGGEGPPLPGRHALHASHISWRGGEVVPSFEVSSPLPEHLAVLLG